MEGRSLGIIYHPVRPCLCLRNKTCEVSLDAWLETWNLENLKPEINRLPHYLQNSESSQIFELKLFLKLQCNLKAWKFVELIEEPTVVSTANGREREFLILLNYWIVLNLLSELNFAAFLNAESTEVKKSSSCHMESRRTPADWDVACVASSSVRK